MAKRLTVQQRREIFRALVTLQDQMPLNVRRTRELIMEQYQITSEQLKAIEDEGLEKEWPPLNEEPVESSLS
jgi:hypothetical protein